MKKKVLIDLEEYNSLLEFKENIEKGNIFIEVSNLLGENKVTELEYFPINEAIILNNKAAQELINKNDELHEKNDELRAKLNKLKQILGGLRYSNIFEFIKWKKANKKNPPFVYTSTKK